MLVCLFEDDRVPHLFPLTRTRAAFSLRAGHRTIVETVAHAVQSDRIVVHTRRALADVVREETDRPVNRIAEGVDVLFVNGRIALRSDDELAPVLEAARHPEPRVFTSRGAVAAAWMPAGHSPAHLAEGELLNMQSFGPAPAAELENVVLADRVWHLLHQISAAVEYDFSVLSHGINVFERPNTDVSDRADLIEGERILMAPGAQVRSGAVLDARNGPIILGEGAVIMEQAVIHGPAAIGAHSIVKVGAHLARCAIGPWCKVSGEVHDSVLHSFSNKSHDGFLGHSYLGSWVNLGAHTNTSNLKNDYGEVSAFNEALGKMEKTGGIFAGLVMADHSKCGIDSMFNTGTVVGVSCNLFGAGYYPRYIPSFMWGSPADGFATYRLDKALAVASAVMPRRDQQLTAAMRDLLTAIHSDTVPDRERGVVT